MNTALFRDFAGLWVPLCLARPLSTERPTPIILAGERIVLFRDEAGEARALLDRCPHRGVALSLGHVRDGAITCPFHGWRFDGSGRCINVPWNPDARLENLSATPLPVREIGGLIWLYTGRHAAGEPMVPEPLLRPDVRVTAQDFVWNVHWTRVMENMLDTPHLPFVHAGSIGKHLQVRTAARMDMSWHETSYGAEIIAERPGEPTRARLRYHFPNTMEMMIDPGSRTFRLLAVCSPAAADQTRLTIYTIRSFAKLRLLDPLFARANARVAAEDRAITESSLPSEVPPASAEKSVASDAPTLAFRKIWFTRIKGG